MLESVSTETLMYKSRLLNNFPKNYFEEIKLTEIHNGNLFVSKHHKTTENPLNFDYSMW